jgi:hypothetical protein
MEVLLCFFCTGIALIVSLVYLITGNPKGLKMLGFAIIMIAVKTGLPLLFFAMNDAMR